MTQIELPLSRRNDPITSKSAATKAESFKARDIERILHVLRINSNPLTYRLIAWLTDMEPVAVARRGAEMKRRGLISMGPDTRDGCQIWRIIK